MSDFSDPPFPRKTRHTQPNHQHYTRKTRNFDLNYQHYFYSRYHSGNNTDPYETSPNDAEPDFGAPRIRPRENFYDSDSGRSDVGHGRTLPLGRQTAAMLTRDLSITLPAHAPSISPSSILILPAHLVSMTAHIRDPLRNETHHLSVVPNMRLRETVRQLLGPADESNGAVKVYIKNRGIWVESGRDVRVRDLRETARAWNRDGEVEVKIVIGGGRGERLRRGRSEIRRDSGSGGLAWIRR